MGDYLEHYVKEHREGFEGDFLPEKSWAKINDALKKEEKSTDRDYNKFWKVAAAVLLVATSALSYLQWGAGTEETVAMNPYEEFYAAESFYTQLISQKRFQIEVYGPSELDLEFEQDLNHLSGLYEELKTGIDRNGSDQKMIDAMIKNLQLRLEILNRQIEVLERLKEYEEENEVSAA